MSTEATGTSVGSVIVVDAPIERAFAVFTEGIGSWFPSEYRRAPRDLSETGVEHVGAGDRDSCAYRTLV